MSINKIQSCGLPGNLGTKRMEGSAVACVALLPPSSDIHGNSLTIVSIALLGIFMVG
jgi:hypothetical protein